MEYVDFGITGINNQGDSGKKFTSLFFRLFSVSK